jgi:carboxypeptidase C (cathepsin A)
MHRPTACRFAVGFAPFLLFAALGTRAAPHSIAAGASEVTADSRAASRPENLVAETVRTTGSVTIGGRRLDYEATAGTLVVHGPDWDDVPQNADPEDKSLAAQASMFYVAYTRRADAGTPRPVTFIYNGGPGSASLYLHMGGFGPKRVLTADHEHTSPAPYTLIANEATLLDVSDLVFIDAPGTGFSRIAGRDRDKTFYGVDADANAFAEFIAQFLGRYGRWNSPKYLLGESYGTLRSAVVADLLARRHSIDLNGVILISQVLNYDSLPDVPALNAGIDLPYSLTLPTYAAAAWYHHRAGAGRTLAQVVQAAEEYALGDYASALLKGNELPAEGRRAVATKLHELTGLPVDYLERSDLRVPPAGFAQELLREDGRTLGQLDARFTGPALDRLAKGADYDPTGAATEAAYVAALNHYAREELKFGAGRTYRASVEVGKTWDWLHRPPGSEEPVPQAANVLPDLADAMKRNTHLKVQLNTGYYDLVTPYFEGLFEMRHLPVSADLQRNVEVNLYESGHMLYGRESVRSQLHDRIAAFIQRTSSAR